MQEERRRATNNPTGERFVREDQNPAEPDPRNERDRKSKDPEGTETQ